MTIHEIQEQRKEKICVATVSVCLTPSHETCTRTYVDTLTGLYVVSCKCECHDSDNDYDSSKLVKLVGDQPTSRARPDLTTPQAYGDVKSNVREY